MRKDAPGMTLESFSQRIMSIGQYDNRKIKLPKKMIQKRFQIGNREIKVVSANKSQFA